MKKFIYKSIILIFVLIFSSCKSMHAQSMFNVNHLTPFTGNWEWVNGNQSFKVYLYIDNGRLKGDYKLVEMTNNSQTIIYSSRVPFGNTGYFATGINGGSRDGITMGSQFADYSWLWNGEDKIKYGLLGITIQPANSLGQIITARWKVEKHSGIRLDTEPDNFVIPTDIVLTKIN